MRLPKRCVRGWLPGLVLGCTMALSSVHPASAQRFWPPWLRDRGKEPVFPEILVSAESLRVEPEGFGAVLVDARSPEAFDRGHVPGALSLPPDELDPFGNLGARLGRRGLSSDRRIVCYGDRESLPQACRLVWLLLLAGATDVGLLNGGIEAWEGSGGVLSRTAAEPVPQRWTAEGDSTRLAVARDVRERFGRRGYEIIDARAVGFGETAEALDSPGSLWRAGHIPDSLPVDFRAVVRPDGRVQDGATIRAHVAATGPRPGTSVDMSAEFIVYDDGLSSEGAVGYVLLVAAGIEKVRYYPGGWADWSARADLPVARIIDAADLDARLRSRGISRERDVPPRDFVLLDVRHDPDYFAGHIPGAVLIPAHKFEEAFSDTVRRYWPDADPRSTPVVVYCYGRECIRSRNGSTFAARSGFLHVEWFRGGMEEWVGAGMQVAVSRQRRE